MVAGSSFKGAVWDIPNKAWGEILLLMWCTKNLLVKVSVGSSVSSKVGDVAMFLLENATSDAGVKYQLHVAASQVSRSAHKMRYGKVGSLESSGALVV